MLNITPANARLWSILGSRGTFGVAMLDAAAGNTDFLVLTADLGVTAGLERFRASYPDRFINTGIAEQNMIGIATGLAKEGHKTFTTTFATFASMRAYEQVRLNLGYMGFDVKVVGMASGVAMGQFGNTHYGIEDIALMRAVPNLTVLAPADGGEIVKTVQALMNHTGPTYLRLTGVMNNPVVYTQDYEFTIGKAVQLSEGRDLTIIACGTMVHASMQAAKALAEKGISAAVINMHTIKPLDTEAIDRSCATTRLVVSVEEHGTVGGLGGAIAEYLSERGNAPPLLRIGLPNDFLKVGEYRYLLTKHGLTGPQIAQTIEDRWLSVTASKDT